MPTRRGFLTGLATGAVGACVAVRVPTGWLPAPVRREAARDYLRRAYNEFTHGKAGAFPRRMTAGRELYDAYASELLAVERSTVIPVNPEVPHLKFKGARLYREGEGWRVACHAA